MSHQPWPSTSAKHVYAWRIFLSPDSGMKSMAVPSLVCPNGSVACNLTACLVTYMPPCCGQVGGGGEDILYCFSLSWHVECLVFLLPCCCCCCTFLHFSFAACLHAPALHTFSRMSGLIPSHTLLVLLWLFIPNDACVMHSWEPEASHCADVPRQLRTFLPSVINIFLLFHMHALCHAAHHAVTGLVTCTHFFCLPPSPKLKQTHPHISDQGPSYQKVD